MYYRCTSRPAALTCSVVSHGFGQHGLTAAWRSVHKDAPGRVDANLRKESEG